MLVPAFRLNTERCGVYEMGWAYDIKLGAYVFKAGITLSNSLNLISLSQQVEQCNNKKIDIFNKSIADFN